MAWGRRRSGAPHRLWRRALLVCTLGLPGCADKVSAPIADKSPPALAHTKIAELEPPPLPSFTTLFQQASPSVVNISATHTLPIADPLLPRRQKEILRALVRSVGSGFVFGHQGLVATCASVVQDAEQIEVILANGQRLEASLVGADPLADLAVLALDPKLAPKALPWAESGSLIVGQWVASFGNPYGLSHTITAGIVSALRSAAELKSSHGLILVDAPISAGSNGGPLLDTQGRVVGINLVSHKSGGGMGLAVPIDEAGKVLHRLSRGENSSQAWLGLSVQALNWPLALSFQLKSTEGALVNKVAAHGPAAKVGIRPGDVIVSFMNRPVLGPQYLINLQKQATIGKQARLTLLRQGKRRQKKIVPRAHP